MSRSLLLPALGFLTILGAPSQTTSPDSKGVSEPEFADVFYRLDAGALVPLERQTVTYKSKVSGFMVINMKTASEIAGAKSSVRFRAGQLEFIVRALMPTAFDPDSVYSLRRLNTTKKTRELGITTTHGTPFGASSTAARDAIVVTFAKYGSSSLKLSADLPPGEYAIGRTYLPTVFCFGVD